MLEWYASFYAIVTLLWGQLAPFSTKSSQFQYLLYYNNFKKRQQKTQSYLHISWVSLLVSLVRSFTLRLMAL